MSDGMAPEVPQEEVVQPKQPELVAGYLVGLTEDGNFVFELVSKEQTLIELLGIQRYAESRVKSILDSKINTGDKITLELGKVVGTLAQEVAKLTVLLKKPDNKLA